jgi:hypothetical protein
LIGTLEKGAGREASSSDRGDEAEEGREGNLVSFFGATDVFSPGVGSEAMKSAREGRRTGLSKAFNSGKGV